MKQYIEKLRKALIYLNNQLTEWGDAAAYVKRRGTPRRTKGA